MSMSQTVHLRAASSSFSHPYLERVHRLPQVPTPARPSPEVISRKPLGILLTLLKSTLAKVYQNKRFHLPLESTLMKNRRVGGAASRPPYSSHPSARCCRLLLWIRSTSLWVEGKKVTAQ